MTTPSSTYETTTPNPIPAPSPTHDIDNIDNNIPPLVLNETNKNYKEDLNEMEKEPMNPLLPTVIILSSIVGGCI